MGSLFKNKKGNAELVAFLLILPLFLLPIWDGFQVFSDLYRYDILKQAARQALLRMESKGGLTPADYDSLVLYLTERGFAEDNLDIDYTPFPINYGDDVAISLSYSYTRTRYNLGLTGLQRVEETGVMVCGPYSSTSKHYER